MDSANDAHFDPRRQLRSLSEDQLLDYVSSFVDRHCPALDAAYLKEVVHAGPASPELTRRHAALGSAMAQAVLGTAMLRGEHVEGDVPEALFWLLRASNNGNPHAAVMLADAYLQGRHVSRNLDKALQYATMASDRGLPAGQFFLANLLVGGDGIAEDEPRAISLLRAAASAGLASALRMLEDNGIPLAPV